MRSIGTLAVVTGMMVLASACSDGGGTPPPDNTPPTAGFTHSCNALACTFTSTSTDVAPGTIVTHVWAFGDGGTANGNNPSHSYSVTAPTDFTVTLTVTDNEGDSDVETQTVTVVPVVTPVNTPPTAVFSHTCSAVDNAAACIFISTSTDVPPGTIATHAWAFGDGGTADVSNPSHSYAITVPTDFTVTLTVTDNEGATAVATQTVTGVPVNTPPVAGFTHECNLASKCTFTNTSTDLAPGTIATYAWTFGDGGTADVSSPSHVYAIPAPADFTVTLTVTDDAGATAVATQTVTATPPPPGAEGCTTVSATRLECAFNVTARSTIKLKLLAISCDLSSKITAPPPIGDQVFLGVCRRTVGEELGIFGGPEDHAIVYEAGSQVRIRYDHGNADADDPDLGPPTATFSGTYPDWTINFEDGDHQGAAGEPDFTDVVLGVHATEVP